MKMGYRLFEKGHIKSFWKGVGSRWDAGKLFGEHEIHSSKSADLKRDFFSRFMSENLNLQLPFHGLNVVDDDFFK